jgi:hypothetical protein
MRQKRATTIEFDHTIILAQLRGSEEDWFIVWGNCSMFSPFMHRSGHTEEQLG